VRKVSVGGAPPAGRKIGLPQTGGRAFIPPEGDRCLCPLTIKEAEMRTRSFSELLADWQGGIRPKPGSTKTITDVPEELIINVWGYVPSAIAFEGTTFMFRKSRPGFYRVTVRFT
jgi:hypothetical protein